MSNVTNLDKAAAKLAKAKKTRSPSGGAFDSSGRRVIRHDPGHLPEILDQIEDALAAAPEHNVFRYAGRIARVYQADEAVRQGRQAPGRRHHGAPRRSRRCSPNWPAARHCMKNTMQGPAATRHATARCAWRFTSSPVVITRSFPTFKASLRRQRSPAPGALSTGPVTMPRAACFAHLRASPAMFDRRRRQRCVRPNRPSASCSACLPSFPFVDDIDRAAMLAGLLTALQRRLLPSAPISAITAPAAGTGKTQLCESLAIVITDRRASVLSLGHDDAETEKRLTGVSGRRCGYQSRQYRAPDLRGDLLCQISTQTIRRLRPLGGSGMLSVPTHAVLIATGNNLAHHSATSSGAS